MVCIQCVTMVLQKPMNKQAGMTIKKPASSSDQYILSLLVRFPYPVGGKAIQTAYERVTQGWHSTSETYLLLFQYPILILYVLALPVLSSGTQLFPPLFKSCLAVSLYFLLTLEALRHLLLATATADEETEEYLPRLFRIRVVYDDAAAEASLLSNGSDQLNLVV